MNPFLEANQASGGGRGNKRSESIVSDRTVIVIIIYISLLLDNVLLTVIVPILPDFLLNSSAEETKLLYKKYDLEFVSNILTSPTSSTSSSSSGNATRDQINAIPLMAMSSGNMEDENVAIGVLLSTKAFVQLAFNPIIGAATKRVGYQWPILLGTMSLVLSSFLFAIAENYYSLLFARSMQGVGSSCLGVCGMSLVAHLYPEDDKRSRLMGIVLGSIALGVLIGYPVGGILYEFVGKSSPFWIICTLLVLVVGFQVKYLRLEYPHAIYNTSSSPADVNGACEETKWQDIISDLEIILISLAIYISTSVMAILEPCLPLWLLGHLHPEKWQLGTVFIPDSLGYLIGTNGFGKLAYELGQIRVAVVALIVIGCSCIIIPISTSMASLLVPHFGLGLGIGVLDAALVPYLSSRIDMKYGEGRGDGGEGYSDISGSGGGDGLSSNYGTVYAIQQMAVSLAYSASPLLASEIVKFIGFPTLMLVIGVFNIVYGLFFYYFTTMAPFASSNVLTKYKNYLLPTMTPNSRDSPTDDEPNPKGSYNRFYNSIN